MKSDVMHQQGFGIKRETKLLLLAFCIFTIIAFYFLNTSQVSGYEVSIYQGTSPVFWIYVFMLMIIGIFLIARKAFSGVQSDYWLLGFFLLIFMNFCICSLSFLRGYYLYNPIDPGAHIGITGDILETGYTGISNIYPAIHILVAQLAMQLHTDPTTLAKIVPAFLSCIYILNIYLLSSVFCADMKYRLIVIICSVPLLFSFFHTGLYPQGFAFFLLPLVFYLYFKSWNSDWKTYKLLFIIVLLIIPISHPHTAIVLLIFLLIVESIRAVHLKKSYVNKKITFENFLFIPIILAIVEFIFWISRFSDFAGKISYVDTKFLKGSITPPQLMKAQKSIDLLDFNSLIELFLKSYAHLVIFGLLSLFSIFLIFKLYKSKQISIISVPVVLAIWILFSEIFSVFFFIVVQTQVPTRVIAADNMLLLSPLLIGFLLYYLFEKKIQAASIIKFFSILLIIGLVASIGIFSLYRSPWVFQPNWQSTKYDNAGTAWLLTNRYPGYIWNGLSTIHTDFEIILGHERYLSNPDTMEITARIGYYGYEDVPSHFDFTQYLPHEHKMNPGTKSNTVGESIFAMKDIRLYGSKFYREYYYLRYWGITERGKIVSLDEALKKKHIFSHSEIGRWDFDPVDFIIIENDPTLQRVYANGEFTTYYIDI